MVDTHDDILELMVEVADRVIRPGFRALSGNDIDEKSPGDYVTVADRESEKLLTAALLARNPGCLVVGEEASYADPSIREGLGVADLAYTVHPVDGTGNFVKGSPDYAVMIAEIRRSEVTRSWIWQPGAGRAYVAERGAGVTCSGEPMTRVEAHRPARAGGASRVWQCFDSADGFAEPVGSNFCAGFDYPQLLRGEADFFVYRRPMPWDHLPGLLMVRELGGATVQVDGRGYGPGSQRVQAICASTDAGLADDVAGRWDPPEAH